MMICELIDLVYKDTKIGCLRIYSEGSGNPSEDHAIKAISIAGHRIGDDVTPDKYIEGMIIDL